MAIHGKAKMAKKKMRGGGMSMMAKKKMMRGGMSAKKKMMGGGRTKSIDGCAVKGKTKPPVF